MLSLSYYDVVIFTMVSAPSYRGPHIFCGLMVPYDDVTDPHPPHPPHFPRYYDVTNSATNLATVT